MLFFKTKVRHSRISGRGLFAKEFIKAGSVIGDMSPGCRHIPEIYYQTAQIEGDEQVIHTGIRLAKDIFIYRPENKSRKDILYDNEVLINHSNEPTMLYHCGLLFALKDIHMGDEMTVNYKYFLSEDDITSFEDAETGQQVRGLSSDEALLESTLELVMLLKRTELGKGTFAGFLDMRKSQLAIPDLRTHAHQY